MYKKPHSHNKQPLLRINTILGLHLIDFFLFLLDIRFLESLAGLIVQYNQVPIANIEAGQVVTRVLRIKNIFIYYECCSTGIGRVTHTYLTDGAVFAEYVVHFLSSDLVGEVADIKDPVYFWRKPHLK